MNWIDLGVLIFAIVLIVIGIKRGFMTSVINHFSGTLNLLLSFFLYKPVQWCFNKWFGLGDAIASHYSKDLISECPDFAVNLMDIPKGDLRKFVSGALRESGLSGVPRFFYNVFMNNSSLYSKLHDSGLESRTLAQIVSESLSAFFTTIIAFVTAFALLYLIIWLITLLVKKLREIGFIKAVDNTLGALYGIFQGFLVLIIVCLVLKLMSPFNFMEAVETYINGSLSGRFIYRPINEFIDHYLNFGDLIRQIF